jgi:hypothetical protein
MGCGREAEDRRISVALPDDGDGTVGQKAIVMMMMMMNTGSI